MSTNIVLLADTIRQISMQFKVKMKTPDPREHRYEEGAGEYKLQTWLDGHQSTEAGMLHMRPEWLSTIINVARIGDYAKNVSEPPPDIIVWFRTKPDYTLHSFIDFTNQ